MRDAMELVASRVDALGKAKITPQPNQGTTTQQRPTTSTTPVQPVPTKSTAGPSKPKQRKKKAETAYPDWDSRQYKGTESERKLDRAQRPLAREEKQKEAEEELAQKVKALQTFDDDDDDDEEPENTAPVPDPPAKPTTTEKKQSTAAKNRRQEMKEAKEKRDKERARAAAEDSKPKGKSPGRATEDSKPKGKSPGRSTKGAKTPKQKTDEPATSREKDDGNKKASNARPTKGAKVPLQKRTTQDDDATNRKVEDKKQKTTEERDDTTSRKIGLKTKDKAKHVDDEEYELNLKTGKFVKKRQEMVQREDDDDDDDVQMEEIDDEDIDGNYDPDKDPDKGVDDDEDDEENVEPEDDDDFKIPPLRKRKVAKTGDDATTSKKHKKLKESDEALHDLADFVEDAFPRESRQKKHQTKKDACINPAEAAHFRKAMQKEVMVLEQAVRKGRNVSDTYHTMVVHIIQACKDIKYDIPTDIEVEDIFPSIEDPNCKAWQLKIQGVETAGEGELNISKTDNSGVCIAKKKFEIKDVLEYATEVSKDWTDLKRKSFVALHSLTEQN